MKDYYTADGGDYRAVFSRYDLDSDEVVDVPRMNAFSCHLQGGMDPELWREQGMSEAAHANFVADEAEVAEHGIQVLKTCTPYLAGNMPVMGEHCAWMESSAVVFANTRRRRAHQLRRPRDRPARRCWPSASRTGAFTATTSG